MVDYTLLNQPTRLLERLAELEAQLEAIRKLQQYGNIGVWTKKLRGDKYVKVSDIEAAIGESE